MILADKIMQMRKQAGWSQEELADKMEVSRQSVSKWESGMSVPDLNKILKLSELFEVSTDYLLKDEMEEAEPTAIVSRDTFGEETEPMRSISMNEAEAYLNLTEKTSRRIALGVFLCILSPISLIQLGGVAEYKYILSENTAVGLGMIILMGMVLIAVAIFILNGMGLSKYEYLEKEVFSLQYGVKSMVERRKQAHEGGFRRHVTIGVCLCIASVIPLFAGTMLEIGEYGLVTCINLLLGLVAVGVLMMVPSALIHESYEKLLQTGDYTVEKKELGRRTAYFPPIYWCIVVAVYLGISFYTEEWERTWIVWPVAGVLFAALYGIVRAVENARWERRR